MKKVTGRSILNQDCGANPGAEACLRGRAKLDLNLIRISHIGIGAIKRAISPN